MYYEQKGWKTASSKMIGYILVVAISSCLLLYAVGMWLSMMDGSSADSIIGATLDYVVVTIGMATIAMYNLWKFPNIITSDTGLRLKVFFFTLHIDWKNILRVQKKDQNLIIFLTKKGLFLNRLYGLFYLKIWDQPVVFFVSSTEIVNRLEADIKMHLIEDPAIS